MQTIIAKSNSHSHAGHSNYQKEDAGSGEHQERMMNHLASPPSTMLPHHSHLHRFNHHANGGGYPFTPRNEVEKFIMSDDESENTPVKTNYFHGSKQSKDMYHPEANMVSLDFDEPSKGAFGSKGNQVSVFPGSVVGGGSSMVFSGSSVPQSSQQQQFNGKGKQQQNQNQQQLQQNQRRPQQQQQQSMMNQGQAATPTATIQRRMLQTNSIAAAVRNTLRMVPPTRMASKPQQKRRWKIIYFPRY